MIGTKTDGRFSSAQSTSASTHFDSIECVDRREKWYPKIPSGEANNDVLLGTEEKQSDSVSKDGMVLV